MITLLCSRTNAFFVSFDAGCLLSFVETNRKICIVERIEKDADMDGVRTEGVDSTRTVPKDAATYLCEQKSNIQRKQVKVPRLFGSTV